VGVKLQYCVAREACVVAPLAKDLNIDRFNRKPLKTGKPVKQYFEMPSTWKCRTPAERLLARRLLARPAALGKHQPPLVGGTTKRTRQFESFVTFRTGGHLARLLEGVRGSDIPVESIRRALSFLAHRTAELLLPTP
jgi:hypothetical protein